MVVLSQPVPTGSSHFQTCKSTSDIFSESPVVDFFDPHAKKLIVQACKDLGFFKLINHGIPSELLSTLESEALNFFRLPQQEKDQSDPPSPFGYGSTKIGPNGDTGWLEYLLFSTNSKPHLPAIPDSFWLLASEYVSAVRNMLCRVLEMICDEMHFRPLDVLSKMIRDEKSDSFFRLNHYPPCPDLQALSGRSLVGFGEHSDPQIMSVLTSSDTPGLEICLKNGSWVSVPSDPTSFYFNVGDLLKVLTNGRFRSVKHRAVANCLKSRVSMIYFGGPPLDEKINPLCSLMEEGEESLYEEFTWSEYKESACYTKLGDDRLKLFEKTRDVFFDIN